MKIPDHHYPERSTKKKPNVSAITRSQVVQESKRKPRGKKAVVVDSQACVPPNTPLLLPHEVHSITVQRLDGE